MPIAPNGPLHARKAVSGPNAATQVSTIKTYFRHCFVMADPNNTPNDYIYYGATGVDIATGWPMRPGAWFEFVTEQPELLVDLSLHYFISPNSGDAVRIFNAGLE